MSSAKPRISVVVATYNGARHIKAQLESIINQRYQPFEILVGDDGSNDGTIEIVRDIANTSTVPVRLTVNQTRLGYADNFLQTAERAEGDLVAFSDQDDVWFLDKLEVSAGAFADPELSMWMHGMISVDEHLNPLPHRRFHTGIVERTHIKFPILVPHGARIVFRSSILRRFPSAGRSRSVHGDRPAHHDEWIMFAGHALGRVGLFRPPLMMYRRHTAAVSSDCSPVKTIPQMLVELPAVVDNQAVAARERARYLRDRAAEPANTDVRERLLAVARYYDGLAPRLERRAVVRGGRSRPSRFGALATHVALGDYRPVTRSGLGAWSLAQDLASVVLTAPEPPFVADPAGV